MKGLHVLFTWVIGGGLIASSLLNLYLVERIDSLEAQISSDTRSSPTLEPILLPESSPTLMNLGLSGEQSDRIRSSSMT